MDRLQIDEEEEVEVPASSTKPGRTRAWSRVGATPEIKKDEARSQMLDGLNAGLSAKGVLDDGEGEEGISEEEEEAAPQDAVERSGFMMKKSGTLSGYKRRYFVLPPCGTLLWYKSEKDKTPTGYTHLSEVSIIEPTGPTFAKLQGSIKGGTGVPLLLRGRKDYVLICDDERERDGWLRDLRRNANLPPMAGLKGGADERGSDAVSDAERGEAKAAKRSMLGGVVLRAEKRMASRAITSDLGKKLLREFCLPETFTLLEALRNLASNDSTLPPKSGVLFENTVLRIAVKLVLLLQKEALGPSALHGVSRDVDAMCIELVRATSAVVNSGEAKTDPKDPTHAKLSRMILDLEAKLVATLSPHISPKNMDALKQVTSYLGDPATLQRMCVEPAFEKDRTTLVTTLASMYGIETTGAGGEADGTVRSCEAIKGRTPKKFRANVSGLEVGTIVYCSTPCCAALIKIRLPEEARRFIAFAPPASCLASCGDK